MIQYRHIFKTTEIPQKNFTTHDQLRRLVYGLPMSVEYLRGFPEEYASSIQELLALYRTSINGPDLSRKGSFLLSSLAPLLDKMNHRLMLLNLKMLQWDRTKLRDIEKLSQEALPNHHLALDIWDIDTIIDTYKVKHYGKPLDVTTRFLSDVMPLYNRIRAQEVDMTHQTRQLNAEDIRVTGSISSSPRSTLARFSGVNVGLFGSYQNWIDGMSETFSFKLPLQSIYPRFVNTSVPRVSAVYPTKLPLDKKEVSTIWDRYAVLWPRSNNKFQKKALLSMYTEGPWELVDIGEEQGKEIHYIQTNHAYYMTAALCDVLGMSDCYAVE